MDQIDKCEICGANPGGKYDFYYGQYLGATDVARGGPGGINSWKEHYRVLGKSSAFLCPSCTFHDFVEHWKKWFTFDADIMICAIIAFFLALYLAGATIWFFPVVVICFSALVFLANLILTYSLGDFGTELAFKTKMKNAPNFSQLVMISPAKYAVMENQAKLRAAQRSRK